MIRLNTPDDPPDTGGVVSEPKPHYFPMTRVNIDYQKAVLRTESDVDDYVEAYRKALIKHIKNNRRILI